MGVGTPSMRQVATVAIRTRGWRRLASSVVAAWAGDNAPDWTPLFPVGTPGEQLPGSGRTAFWGVGANRLNRLRLR